MANGGKFLKRGHTSGHAKSDKSTKLNHFATKFQKLLWSKSEETRRHMTQCKVFKCRVCFSLGLYFIFIFISHGGFARVCVCVCVCVKVSGRGVVAGIGTKAEEEKKISVP